MFNRDNYIVIQGFAITELKLSGNELICYSLIYGFSQDKDSEFKGSLNYIASALNIDRRNVKSILDRLIAKGLLIKRDLVKDKVKLCYYRAKYPQGSDELSQGGRDESSTGGRDKSSTNNTIFDNSTSDKSKDIPPNNPPKFSIRYMLITNGVSEEIVDAYMQVRKAHKAPDTKIAYEGIIREVNKCGLPLNDIIRECAERGWVGFKAEWIKPKTQQPTIFDGMSEEERAFREKEERDRQARMKYYMELNKQRDEQGSNN